jgi:hypothetical protein
MTSPQSDPIEDFIRKAGAELEEAFRSEGRPLPPGVSGESMVRWAIGEMRRDHDTWAPEFQRLEQETRAELPPTASKDDYIARLSSKVQEWLRLHPSDPGSRG